MNAAAFMRRSAPVLVIKSTHNESIREEKNPILGLMMRDIDGLISDAVISSSSKNELPYRKLGLRYTTVFQLIYPAHRVPRGTFKEKHPV